MSLITSIVIPFEHVVLSFKSIELFQRLQQV